MIGDPDAVAVDEDGWHRDQVSTSVIVYVAVGVPFDVCSDGTWAPTGGPMWVEADCDPIEEYSKVWDQTAEEWRSPSWFDDLAGVEDTWSDLRCGVLMDADESVAARLRVPGPDVDEDGEPIVVAEWTAADDLASAGEGWCISECSGSADGPLQLQGIDEGGLEDVAAWELVGPGSTDLHRRALAYLLQNAPVEFGRIDGWCRARSLV